MRNRQEGVSLIESLVALLLVTLALFLTLHLTTRQPRLAERLRVHGAALRTLEAAVETVRGGTIPLIEGRTKLAAPQGYLTDPSLDGLQVTMDVVRSPETEDLYALTLEARYLFADRVQVRRIQTLVWRP